MKFPTEEDVRAYWKAAQQDWWAGRITRAEYHRRIHESVATFRREQNADENRKIIQWLRQHQGEWNREVIETRKTLIRRYLKQSKMTAEEFLAQLIETWRCVTATDTKTEAVKQYIVRKLESIQKGVTVAMNNREPNTPEANLAELEYTYGEPQGGETADLRERPAHQVSPIDRLPETVSISEMAKRCGAPAPKGEM